MDQDEMSLAAMQAEWYRKRYGDFAEQKQASFFEEPETLPYQPRSQTSRAAAGEKRADAPTDRESVLRLLTRALTGMTDEEIQRALKMNPNTARPRRIELVVSGQVRDSGRTRKTASGRAATVWEVCA